MRTIFIHKANTLNPNEIAASLIFNRFKAVKLIRNEDSKTLILNDLSHPLPDLISPSAKTI